MLKQKKMLEGQRDQLYNQQFNMEQTSFALESMKDSVNQVKAMKAANTELKKAFKAKELNISSIDKLHDDMADMMVSSVGSCAAEYLSTGWRSPAVLVCLHISPHILLIRFCAFDLCFPLLQT